MANGNQKYPEANGRQASHTPVDWARAAIMSAMLGIVLLAAIPSMLGYQPADRTVNSGLPPLLALIRGV
jgi:hypothetical protein